MCVVEIPEPKKVLGVFKTELSISRSNKLFNLSPRLLLSLEIIGKGKRRFRNLTTPSGSGESPAECAEAFSTWLEPVRKGQWRRKIGVGVAIGLGIEGSRDGIRP